MANRTHPFQQSTWPPYGEQAEISCDDLGLVLGTSTRLLRMADNGRLVVDEDGDRCIALLSVLCRKSVGAEVLDSIEAAAAHWAAGDKALANLRLVFAGLPSLGSAADAARLEAAAWCLDRGITPRELMQASVLDVRKFNPSQPRVPARSGRESGRWTDQIDSVPSSRPTVLSPPPRPVRVAANGPFTPEGVEATPSQSVDPLDPANLNKEPPTPEEQQAIVETLNTIEQRTTDGIKKLQPHSYRNLPSRFTGAILPSDMQEYISYNVPFANDTVRG